MNNDLVIRFIERQCTIEEAREVLRWIEATEENKAVFCQMQAVHASIGIDHSDRTEKVSPEDVRKIMKEISRKRYRLLPYAAAVVCAVVAVLLFIISPLNERNLREYEKVLAGIEEKKEITLTVNNDKEIELSDTSIVVTYDKKGQILINDTVAVPGERENLDHLNTIRVPYGKRSTLILADGSKVYLNSGSSLVYPAVFAKDKREVYLDGEAYFEVSKEARRKFVVQTAYKAVEVLGTKFNVSVDKRQSLFEAVLVTGKIGLESNTGKIELIPNQYYGYDPDSGQDELKTVDARDYISWIEGRLRFNREPLDKVIHRLEKSYNIKIEILDSKYLKYQISGNLDLKSTPEETMNVLMRILIPGYNSQKQKLYQIKEK
ncbi:FecR domain-containing protein [Parabacteroides goldsteinii]